jgi:hypothetical protein
MRGRSAGWCAVLTCTAAVSAYGQASRTWVSGTGDDAFPCSRTAPCKTFNGAFAKTATNGEISVLDPAGFGAVTITRSVTIDGRDATGVIFANLTTGVTINLTDAADTAKTVRLRGLSINGGGNGISGIKVMAAKRVSIEETVIDGFTQDGVSVGSADSVRVFLQAVTIRNNAGNGLSVSGAGNWSAISDVTLVYNGTGISASAGGIIASFKNNVFYGNKRNGAPTSLLTLKD